MIVIDIKNVSFIYENENGDRSGIGDVNLSIEKGEVVVFAGTSGSGKTTVTRLINGLIPDCYEGRIKGDVTVLGLKPEEEKTIGMSFKVGSVFQNPKSQFFNVNSTYELAFPLENRGISKDEILTKLNKVSRDLDMDRLMNRNMFHLSGGEKQKIAFASVCMSDQEIIVLDEPSSNLDMDAVRMIRNIIKRWKDEGKTILISEHRFFFLKDLMDKLVIMKRGKIEKVYNKTELSEVSSDVLHKMGLRGLELVSGVERQEKDDGFDEYLNIKNLEFYYKGAKKGVHVADVSFRKGHIVAVIGHNGAGKSTFIRCLSGLEKKCSGTVMIGGKEYFPGKLTQFCTMVMQDVNHQLFTDSVENEVMYELKKQKVKKEDRVKKSEEMLKKLNLFDVREQHPMSISGGQKQRLAIATAVLSGKEIVSFDEPTSGLDYSHMKQVSGIIRRLGEMGKWIFVVTHDPEFIANCCDDVVLLEDGDIKDYYPLCENTQDKLLDWFNRQLKDER